MLNLTDLPVRIFDDLRVEADPGARLTPDQGLNLAQHLIATAVSKQIADRLDAPATKVRSRRKIAA